MVSMSIITLTMAMDIWDMPGMVTVMLPTDTDMDTPLATMDMVMVMDIMDMDTIMARGLLMPSRLLMLTMVMAMLMVMDMPTDITEYLSTPQSMELLLMPTMDTMDIIIKFVLEN